MKETLGSICMLLDWSDIAEQYFDRTPQWIYQRLNGSKVNGNPAEFSQEDKDKLRKALLDVSERIKEAALKI